MKELFEVVAPADALRALERELPTRSCFERIPVREALDRVVAEEIHSPEALPAFPRSTMDGFAVRAADTYGASEGLPAYLNVIAEVAMGRAPGLRVRPGDAVRIATGGMLPEGTDAVVMVEHTQEVDSATVEVLRPVAPGEHVLQVGEDVNPGDLLLGPGHVLRPQDLGGLLALGIVQIAVAPRLKVAIVSGGDEILPPEERPGPGQIRDINSYTIAALVTRAGHEPILMGIAPDVLEALQRLAMRAMERADVVILSAGSSVSVRDMTAQVIQGLGEPGVLVHGVSLKPGKPTILAVCNGKPVFGLPGNPVSCMVTFDLFVVPILARLSGASGGQRRRTVLARLARNVASAAGREDYLQVRLERRDGELWADPVFGKSGLIYTLIRADGMLHIGLDAGGVSAGELVEVVLF